MTLMKTTTRMTKRAWEKTAETLQKNLTDLRKTGGQYGDPEVEAAQEAIARHAMKHPEGQGMGW